MNQDFTRFWRCLTADEKRSYAKKVGCTLTTLTQISSKTRLPSLRLAEKMKQAADGELDNVELRPAELLAKLRIRQRA